MKSMLLSLAVAILFATSVLAQIIHVPDDQQTIQAGINAAIDGDTVLVADGTYLENINFKGKAITVASHFLIDADTSHIANTIIDGSRPSHPDSGSVVYFISDEDTNSVLTGFSITGGTGTIMQEFEWRAGGGIFMSPGGGHIAHNRIFNNNINYRQLGGVGVLSAQPSSSQVAIIEFNQVFANSGQSIAGQGDENCEGGGIAAFTAGEIRINNNEVHDNTLRTGLIFSVGVECANYNWPAFEGKFIVRDNLIWNNIGYPSTEPPRSAGYAAGAGLRIVNTEAEVANNRILNNGFVNNPPAETYGGGVSILFSSSVTMFNNIISGNMADYGGGIQVDGSGAKATMINNVIFANAAGSSGGGIFSEGPGQIVMNTIIWSNVAPTDPQISVGDNGGITVAYSDVQGGWSGEGNIDADPLLMADSLSNKSPCIGAGKDVHDFGGGTVLSCPPFDINGRSRPLPAGSMPDIGASESWRETPDPSTGVDSELQANIPKIYTLHQNYPNPFNPSTAIEFALPKPGFATLKIYNTLGEEVATLVSEKLPTGKHQRVWEAKGLASGVYVYRLKAGEFVQTRKLILLR